MRYKGMSVLEGTDYVMKQLSKEEIEYACDQRRGDYRGFAALQDLMDANMLLPLTEVGTQKLDTKYLEFCNLIMEEVNHRFFTTH